MVNIQKKPLAIAFALSAPAPAPAPAPELGLDQIVHHPRTSSLAIVCAEFVRKLPIADL